MSEPKLNIKEELSQKDPFSSEKTQGGADGAQKEKAENRMQIRLRKRRSTCDLARPN